jgi:hypothetical protein
MDVPNRSCWWLGWSNCIVRCGNRRHPQKLLESGGREQQEIVVLDVAGIAQLVRDAARGHESIACSKNEDPISNDDLQFSDEDKVHLILPSMCMPRHHHPGRETDLEEAICSSRVCSRQTYGTNADVKVVTFGPRLMLDRGSFAIDGLNVEHE